MSTRKEQDAELWARYWNGPEDHKNENELVRNYIPFVQAIASRLHANLPSCADIEDLFSEGLIALWKMIPTFRPDQGSKFTSYAVQRIWGAMLDELRRMSTVPNNRHRRKKRLQLVQAELEEELGRAPSDQELAARIGIDYSELQTFLQFAHVPVTVSLHRKVFLAEFRQFANESVFLSDILPDPREQGPEEESSRSDGWAELVGSLDFKVSALLWMHYHDGLNFAQIATQLSVRRRDAIEMHDEAIAHLREHLVPALA